MKIIHLILGKGNPERMNGVNKVVYYLATTQYNNGLDIEVWGITPKLDTDEVHTNVFKTKLFLAEENHFNIADALLSAISELSEETIFHFHGAFIPEFYTVAKLLNKRNIKFVFTPHGSYNKFALQKSFLKKLVYYFMFERVLLKKASFLHLLGRNEQSYITKLVNRNKIVVIPNGQNIVKSVPQKSISTQDASPVFGFMGRIDIRHKGLDYLLHGFAEYKKQYNGRGKLWILGEGKESEVLKQLAKKLNVEDFIVFYGSKFGEDKTKLMLQFDAFLHTSRYEGIPMAVLESALMGIPCIVSKATNVKEEVEAYKAGIGLGNTSAKSIAEAMVKIEDAKADNKLEVMRAGAVKMVQHEYDWQKIAQRFSQKYNEAV